MKPIQTKLTWSHANAASRRICCQHAVTSLEKIYVLLVLLVFVSFGVNTIRTTRCGGVRALCVCEFVLLDIDPLSSVVSFRNRLVVVRLLLETDTA